MIEVGESFGSACEVTEDDLDLAVRLTRGRHPVHVDAEVARRFGLNGRIFHGAISAAIMTAAIGLRFADYKIAVVGQTNKYIAPVYPGDLLESRWTVVAKEAGGGDGRFIVLLAGELRNRRGELVVRGTTRVFLDTQTFVTSQA